MKEQKRKKQEAKAAKYKQHKSLLKKHQRTRKKNLEAKATRKVTRIKEHEVSNIQRLHREVDLSFDSTVLEDTLREMFAKHGKIECIINKTSGCMCVRFASESGVKSLLKSHNEINGTVSFPITPVVINHHCFYFKPVKYTIDQEFLTATAEYFSSISVVQQVKKYREAVLVVLEDQQTRDEMVKQSEKTNWKILGRSIGACSPGLPPSRKKRKTPKVSTKIKKKLKLTKH